MAYVDYDKYHDLGYSAVPQDQFPRWAAEAEAEAQHAILYRPFILTTDEPVNYNLNDPTAWSERNQRGVCEIMDVLFDLKVSSGTGPPITSFSNQHYSESYAAPTEVQAAARNMVAEIVATYFTPEQRYRGVC